MAQWDTSLVDRRYRLDHVIGHGGVATTYRARDLATGDDVAVKVAAGESRALVVAEYELARELFHPHVVEILDLVHDGEVSCLVERLVSGRPLGHAPVSRQTAQDLAGALAFLHEAGIVHGDVKPENMLVDRGRATLLDFSAGRRGGGDLRGLTAAHAAPEVLATGQVSFASDVFALGVCLAGHAALRADQALFEACLSPSPSTRPSARDIAAALGVPLALSAIARLARRFVGREEVVSAVESQWKTRSPILINGPGGIGKSRLLRELRVRASSWARASLRARGEPLSTFLARALELDPAPRSFLEVQVALAKPGPPRVLFIDDIDTVDDEDRPRVGALLRAQTPGNGLVVVATSRLPFDDSIEEAVRLPLDPLSEAAIDAWFEGSEGLRPRARDGSGTPGRILSLVRDEVADASGSLTAAALERLALLEANHDPVALALALQFAPDLDPWDDLVASGHAERTSGGFVRSLARTAIVPRDFLTRAHKFLLARAERPETRLVHASLAGDAATARSELAALDERLESDPGSLRHDARRLGGSGDGVVLAFAAHALERAGSHRDSARILLRAALLAPARSRPRIALTLARLLVRAGDQRALRVLRRVPAKGPLEAKRRAEEALFLLKSGRFDEAARSAREGLVVPGLGEGDRRDLEVSLALASSWLGNDVEAEALLSHHGRGPTARSRYRLENARGTVKLRAGKLAEAKAAYSRALDEVRHGELDDLATSATINAAVVSHQAGDFGEAHRLYERAHDLARLSGARRARDLVATYRARLFTDLGATSRARAALLELPEERLPSFHEASRLALEGELALHEGRFEDARALAERAEAACVDAPQERAEARLLRIDVAIAEENSSRALELARSLEALVLEIVDPVLQSRRFAVEAEVALADGRSDEAVVLARRSLGFAEASGHRGILAGTHRVLARALDESGAKGAAARHEAERHSLVEEIAAELPSDLREAFVASRVAHPSLPRVSSTAPGEATTSLLALPRALLRVVAASGALACLELSLREAIELTRAERGFVLLANPKGEPEVVFARNVDREAIKKPRHKFSSSIALSTLRKGESTLITNALTDPSIARGATVHRLGLKSVLCVPLRSDAETIGALYLDHRFVAGAFGPADEEAIRILAEATTIAVKHARSAELLRSAPRVPEPEREDVAVQERAPTVVDRTSPFPEILTRSPVMLRVLERIERVSLVDVPVLVGGESGTGKEMIARALHHHGSRKEGPFVAINCGALPESLLEAELFGYVRGAFTGANQDKAGLFVAARGGVLFLDELGEMPLSMQVKLLRALQEREVRPLGATSAIPIDVRLVCATNRDLKQEVAEGRFREDLYYRVAVVDVKLPSLRERIEDVPLIAEAFVERLVRESGIERRLDPKTIARLVRHDFPGNVRELENLLVRAFYLGEGRTLELELGSKAPVARRRPPSLGAEKELILGELARQRWNVRRTADKLGIPRATFYRKLALHGIRRDRMGL